MQHLYKYPRTHHVEGSRFQPGDEELRCIPLIELKGRHLVVEEKVDGGNSGISFDAGGRLYLQSRGHFLDGGHRERHFALFKTWANRWNRELFELLGSRFVMYGEWVYAKHTVFYDALPHYFIEFDVLDTETGFFLSTETRRAMLSGSPVESVHMVGAGAGEDFRGAIGKSEYKTASWLEQLQRVTRAEGLREDLVLAETDRSELAEGLYLKIEEEGRVVERYKFIRDSFLQSVQDSGSHWLDRPIVPNQLREGVDLFN